MCPKYIYVLLYLCYVSVFSPQKRKKMDNWRLCLVVIKMVKVLFSIRAKAPSTKPEINTLHWDLGNSIQIYCHFKPSALRTEVEVSRD